MSEVQTRGRDTFVAPYKEAPAQIVEVENWRELPSAPVSLPMPHASHKDRAVGFSIAAAPLAGVVGLVVAIVGVIAWQVPVASLVTLLLALGGFALTWLVAFGLHVFVSSDGALFLHVIFAWGYLKREQTERFRRYGLHRGGK